jgi:hypothetical protein
MDAWLTGYTVAELDEAQERYGLRFPPDLIALYRDRRPREGYDWNTEDPRIREMLAWPTDQLLWSVDHGLWWSDWGARPDDQYERHTIVRQAVIGAPRLIPLINHRFIPEEPAQAGNPVFSMFGFDTIYYGADLIEYFSNEFSGLYRVGPVRQIPFWSELVERQDKIINLA